MHILYQREITGESVDRILETASYSAEDGEPTEFCRDLVNGVSSHQNQIDEMLGAISEHWTVHRMPTVDRCILRLATYEILWLDEIPDSVSINEAVEMAKVYGGEDSSKFVNGVLGRLAEQNAVGEDAVSPRPGSDEPETEPVGEDG